MDDILERLFWWCSPESMILVGALVIIFGTLVSTLGTVRSLILQGKQGTQLQRIVKQISNKTEDLRTVSEKIDSQTSDLKTQTTALVSASQTLDSRTKHLEEVSTQIDLQTADTAKRSTEILAQSQAINERTRESLRQLTSEGSYCLVDFVPNDSYSDRRFLSLRAIGDYPLYDVDVLIRDLDVVTEPTLGNLYPGTVFHNSIPTLIPAQERLAESPIDLPSGRLKIRFRVYITSRHASWNESIELEKTAGGWQSAVRLMKSDNNTMVIEHNTPGFPRRRDGSLIWRLDRFLGWTTQ